MGVVSTDIAADRLRRPLNSNVERPLSSLATICNGSNDDPQRNGALRNRSLASPSSPSLAGIQPTTAFRHAPPDSLGLALEDLA